jgi:hypothetical protein
MMSPYRAPGPHRVGPDPARHDGAVTAIVIMFLIAVVAVLARSQPPTDPQLVRSAHMLLE